MNDKSVRLNHLTVAALEMIAAEERAATGESLTLNEVAWRLVEECRKHVADRVKQLAEQSGKK